MSFAWVDDVVMVSLLLLGFGCVVYAIWISESCRSGGPLEETRTP